jgi:hypothetical protein
MSDELQDEQQDTETIVRRGRGGKRKGAGRPKGSANPRTVELWAKARGIHPATAAEILREVGERRLWARALESEEDRVMLDALKFLTTMRDGKPMQQINVTSMNMNVTAEDIARARSIAATLRATADESQLRSEGAVINALVKSTDVDEREGEEKAKPMLFGGEGAKKGGVVS